MCFYHLFYGSGQLLYIHGAFQLKQERDVIYGAFWILAALCKNTLLGTGKRIYLPLFIGSDLGCKHDIVFQFFNSIVFMDIACFYRNAKLIGDQNAELHSTDGRQSCFIKACINSKEIIFHYTGNDLKNLLLHRCFRLFQVLWL